MVEEQQPVDELVVQPDLGLTEDVPDVTEGAIQDDPGASDDVDDEDEDEDEGEDDE